MTLRTQVRDTSIEAYHNISNTYKATVCDSIYSIVAESNSALSLREIQSRYNSTHQASIDVSTVSGRVNELIAAGRLERTAPVRKCTFSGKSVHPVSIVPVQMVLI